MTSTSTVWRINLQEHTPLTSGFLKDYVWFSQKNAVSPEQKKEEGRRRRTWSVPGFLTCRSPQWVLGKTASSFFSLSFHYFIITFPSIFSYSQCSFERGTAWKHTILGGIFFCFALCVDTIVLFPSAPSSTLQRFPGQSWELGCPVQWSLFPGCWRETNIIFGVFSVTSAYAVKQKSLMNPV